MTAEPSAAPPVQAGARRDVPWLAAGAMSLAVLDATVADLAVPDPHADFADASLSGLTWVVTLHSVLFAALLAPAGRLADLAGRRVVNAALAGVFLTTRPTPSR
ncbi:hypothetical protein [Actinomadura fibrosa]|uniref:MFS transporter n=1 Tax=Actinomadura fibrosa TaxID=111802 RepID=A0ABW2XMT5_9ACTN|nr:hypothetical protein [Actinomadura fibrosa]